MGKYSRQPEPKRGPGVGTIIAIIVAVVLVIGIVAGIFILRNKFGGKNTPETEPTGEVQGEPVVEAVLPKLYLDGSISGATQSGVPFRYLSGDAETTGYAAVSILERSAQLDKKDYTISLFADQGCSQALPLNLGWGEQSVYSLEGNAIDGTYARDIVAGRLLAQMQSKYGVFPNTANHGAGDGIPVEVYNKDAFLGIYTVNIPMEPWMLGMDAADSNHMALFATQPDSGSAFLESPGSTTWSIEVGADDFTSFSKIMAMCDFVMNASDEEFKANFTQYFNLDAVLNYYVLADVAYLHDHVASNMLLVTYGGKTWYPVPYNMDGSWGLMADGSGTHNYKKDMIPFFNSYLFTRVENIFAAELQARYTELRQDILSEEHILAEFDAIAAAIPAGTLAQEQEKWGAGQGMDQVREYLSTRLPALDEKYSDWNGYLKDRGRIATDFFRTMGVTKASHILGTPFEKLARALDIFDLPPAE